VDKVDGENAVIGRKKLGAIHHGATISGYDCPDRGFSWFFSVLVNARIVPRSGEDRILPNPFHFIVHLSSKLSTLYIVDIETYKKWVII
jgi:hypothetical protein